MGSVRKISKQICIVATFSIMAISLNSLNLLAASEHEYTSKYIGQEKRDIKSLSDEDIKEGA